MVWAHTYILVVCTGMLMSSIRFICYDWCHSDGGITTDCKPHSTQL